MQLFENIIAIDKDDTLNYLTLEICKLAGITDPKDVPSLDVIKAKKAPKAFYEAREKFFSDPSVFASPPYGGARKMVDMAKERNLIPKICTKTMTTHPDAAKITMYKMDFWLKYFNDIEMHIVTGKKSIDAVGLIDDSANNGLIFNKRNHRPFLVWSHKYSEEVYTAVLDAFYLLANELLKQEPRLPDCHSYVNWFIDFKGDKIELTDTFSNDDRDGYTLFYSVFGKEDILYHIHSRGEYTGEIDDLVNIVNNAEMNCEADYERELLLVSAYNLINALEV